MSTEKSSERHFFQFGKDLRRCSDALAFTSSSVNRKITSCTLRMNPISLWGSNSISARPPTSPWTLLPPADPEKRWATSQRPVRVEGVSTSLPFSQHQRKVAKNQKFLTLCCRDDGEGISLFSPHVGHSLSATNLHYAKKHHEASAVHGATPCMSLHGLRCSNMDFCLWHGPCGPMSSDQASACLRTPTNHERSITHRQGEEGVGHSLVQTTPRSPPRGSNIRVQPVKESSPLGGRMFSAPQFSPEIS